MSLLIPPLRVVCLEFLIPPLRVVCLESRPCQALTKFAERRIYIGTSNVHVCELEEEKMDAPPQWNVNMTSV